MKKTKIDLIKLDASKTSQDPSLPQQEESSSMDSATGGLKKSGGKKSIFVYGIVGFLLLGGGIGAGGYMGYVPIPGLSHKKNPAPSKSVSKEIGPIVKLSPLVINLREEGGRNYLKITIALEIGSKKMEEEVKSKISLFTDMAVNLLSDKQMEELRQPGSKNRLKQELQAKMNQPFSSPRITGVYFDEFLFQ